MCGTIRPGGGFEHSFVCGCLYPRLCPASFPREQVSSTHTCCAHGVVEIMVGMMGDRHGSGVCSPCPSLLLLSWQQLMLRVAAVHVLSVEKTRRSWGKGEKGVEGWECTLHLPYLFYLPIVYDNMTSTGRSGRGSLTINPSPPYCCALAHLLLHRHLSSSSTAAPPPFILAKGRGGHLWTCLCLSLTASSPPADF